MAQSQTVKEHLRAFHDEIKSATNKEDTEAKGQLRTAQHHLDSINEAIKGDITQDNAISKREAEETLAKVQKLNEDMKSALTASGKALHDKVQAMEKSAKSAMESAK